MLRNLLIKNYALITHLEMQPAPGFNIITGETGAGKSIMLGAIGLLLGHRADHKALWHKEEKCVVEGSFDLRPYKLEKLFQHQDWDYDHECIIRREINPSGKSRAFINDSPVNLEALKKLGQHLLDVHSQHDTLQLGTQQFQLEVIDSFGETAPLKTQYQKHFQIWRDSCQRRADLTEQANQHQQEADYRNFLLEELVKSELQVDEQEQLEADMQVMEHAEEIKTQLNLSLEALEQGDGNIQDQLSMVVRALDRIQNLNPEYGQIRERLQSAFLEIQDVASEVNNLEQGVAFDPLQVEQNKDRLDLIHRLQQKHQVNSIKELLDIQAELEQRQLDLRNVDDALKELDQSIAQAEKAMHLAGNKLSQARQGTFKTLEKLIVNQLKGLGIPDAILTIQHRNIEPNAEGLDQIEWLFSANKGITPKSLKQVASGGEFSRLMFCVKYTLAQKVALPTILFDEIDTGISGEIALQMVSMMKEMSKSHQVITISHLPQFAAKGDHHYYVYKETSGSTAASKIRRLEGSERVEMVARMIGGNNPSEIAYANAQELIEPSN